MKPSTRPRIDPLTLSLTDAVEATGIGRTTLREAIKSGRLRARKSTENDHGDPAGKYVIFPADLRAFVESLPEA